MKRDFALPENVVDENDEDERDVTEAFDRELLEDVITAHDGVIAFSFAVHTLQLSVHDFFKATSSRRSGVKSEKCHRKHPQAEYQKVVQA